MSSWVRRAVLCAAAAAVTLAALAAWMTCMPGRSRSRPLPPLSGSEAALRESLREHVRVLASEIGERNWTRYAALQRARRYIEDRLRRVGYRPDGQRFAFRGDAYYNVEATLEGTAGHRRALVLGAHYDSVVGSPGANDNATGVAALLEIARDLRRRTLPLTVRFVAFANEEPPFFNTREGMGSVEYVRRLGAGVRDLVGMISLETIGYYRDEPGTQRYPPVVGWFYPGRGDFIAFVGNLRSRAFLRRVVREFRARARFPSEALASPALVPGVSWSDHRSFWRAGVPAIMVTDTALFRDPEYHSETDTPARLDYGRMARVVSGLAEAVAALAGSRGS
ncbi:MAG: M28 family peptidase [Acidobacteriota bacterium]